MAVIIAIIALIGGFLLGLLFGAKSVMSDLSEVKRTQAIDRANYLQTLRRELANILIWRDPGRYLQLYKQLHTEVTSLASWQPEEVRKRLEELWERYPNFSDFDVLGTREYVLYAEGVSSVNDDELEARYKDLVIFASLSTIAVKAWKDAKYFVHTTSEQELAHLSKYVGRIEDTKLRLRLERAMECRTSHSYEAFENDFYSIRYLHHFAEDRYGIHLKYTNEFGIYSSYVFDDGRVSHRFYRSDSAFQLEQSLDPLHRVLEETMASQGRASQFCFRWNSKAV